MEGEEKLIVNLERRNFKGNTDKKRAVVQKREHRTGKKKKKKTNKKTEKVLYQS